MLEAAPSVRTHDDQVCGQRGGAVENSGSRGTHVDEDVHFDFCTGGRRESRGGRGAKDVKGAAGGTVQSRDDDDVVDDVRQTPYAGGTP